MIPGVHLGVPIADYIRDPVEPFSLNASVAQILLTQSPRHARAAHPRLNPQWRPSAATEDMDIGTAAHAILLEGDRSRLVIVDAADWRKKEAQTARQEARDTGQLPILAKRMDDVEAMVLEALHAIGGSEIADAFRPSGTSEVTLVWREEGDPPIWCRSRPDRVSGDGLVLVDYKTTRGSAEPYGWPRQIAAMGYDLQAAFALRGARVLSETRADDPVFVFMVQESLPPYAVSFVSLAPAWLDWAERKRRAALDLWRECVRTGQWPGYPARIAYAEPPGYAEYAWSERYGVPNGAAPIDDGRPIADQLLLGEDAP